MSVVKKILTITTELRKKYEKRSEPRNFLEAYEGKLILPPNRESLRISLGYLERFLLKAVHENIDGGAQDGVLSLSEWKEGCGFFDGNYSFAREGKEVRRGSFQWSGQGAIENTWDNFGQFN